MLQLKPDEMEPNFGNTTRYYDVAFVMGVAVVLLLVPVVAWELYTIRKVVHDKSTADVDVLRNFLRGMYLTFFTLIFALTMAIPTSLQLSLAHGGSASTSGLVVGAASVGLPAIILCRYWGPVRDLQYPISAKIWLSGQLLTHAVLTALTCSSPFPGSLWCIIGVKFVGGMFHAFIMMKLREHVPATLQSADLTTYCLICLTTVLLAHALGPIVGSICVPGWRMAFRLLGLGLQDLNPGGYCALTQLLWYLVAAPSITCFLPRETHKAGEDTEDPSGDIYRAAPERVRRINVLVCLFCIFFKDMVAAGLEVFDMLLLELEYGWSVETSGFFTGAAILLAIVPLVAYAFLEDMIPPWPNSLIRRGSCFVFVLCSFGAYKALCPFDDNSSCVGWMFSLRVVNYICWSVAGSFVESGMYKFAVNDDKNFCSFQSIAFYLGVAIEGISRGGGPYLVRSFYEYTGRLGACILITFVEASVLFAIVFGLLVPFRKYWS